MSWFGGKKKQKKKQYLGFPDDCSPEQLEALATFKKYVNQNTKTQKAQYDDIYLLRFLRARKFDIPKTTKMWDLFIEWRIKKDIDNYQHFKFPELPTLRKMYPHGYHKVDKNYRPIYIQRVGMIDVEKIFKVMDTQNLLQYYAVLYETLLTTIFDGCTKAREQATGQHNKVAQTITILDMKNVKLGSASKAYDFVKPVSAMAQDNYPQILGNMFIINAPMLFTGIWAMVKMWIDAKTTQKIKILGGSYKKQLLQYIDPENLPAFIDGGTCMCNGEKQCNLEMNIGPWNPEGKQMFAENISLEEKKQQQPQQSKAQTVQQVKSEEPKVEALGTSPVIIDEPASKQLSSSQPVKQQKSNQVSDVASKQQNTEQKQKEQTKPVEQQEKTTTIEQKKKQVVTEQVKQVIAEKTEEKQPVEQNKNQNNDAKVAENNQNNKVENKGQQPKQQEQKQKQQQKQIEEPTQDQEQIKKQDEKSSQPQQNQSQEKEQPKKE